MHNHTHTHTQKKSTKESTKEAGTWETVKRTSHKSISRKEGVGQELEVKLMEEGKECHQHCQLKALDPDIAVLRAHQFTFMLRQLILTLVPHGDGSKYYKIMKPPLIIIHLHLKVA